MILLAERPQVHGSGKYEIVDGMQRLNAICGFIKNFFAFNGRYFDLNEFSYAKQLADDKVFEFEENFDKLDRKERMCRYCRLSVCSNNLHCNG